LSAVKNVTINILEVWMQEKSEDFSAQRIERIRSNSLVLRNATP